MIYHRLKKKITLNQTSKEFNRQEDFRKKPLQERKKRAGYTISSPAYCKVHSCRFITKSSSSIFIIFCRQELFTLWCATVGDVATNHLFNFHFNFQTHNVKIGLIVKIVAQNRYYIIQLMATDKHIVATNKQPNKQTQLTTNATFLT